MGISKPGTIKSKEEGGDDAKVRKLLAPNENV